MAAMVLDVDTPSMRSVAGDLGDAGETITQTGGDLDSAGQPAHSEVQGGLESLTVAWGAALDILGEDVSYLSRQVDSAAEVYDVTDQGLANGVNGGQVPR